jgi:hypothetical protein
MAQSMDAAALFEIAENVTSSTDLDTVLEKIGSVAKKLLGCEASAIMLLDDSRKHLYFKVATGERAGSIRRLSVPVGVGVAGWVAQNLKPVLIKDVKDDPRFTGQFDKASGFATRSLICVPMFARGEIIGIAEVLNRTEGTFSEQDLGLLTQLSSLAAVAITNARTVQEQRNFFSHILEVLTIGIESLGPQFQGHPWRSQRLASLLARRLEISHREMTDLLNASLLHDIGFIATRVPGYLKGLTLTPAESAVTKLDPVLLHPIIGERMLTGIDLFKGALPLIRHHHENFDGSGFPNRLRGREIPLGSRILCLVELVEEIQAQVRLSPEVRREQVKTEVANLAGTKLDPQVAQAYLDALEEEDLQL